MRRDLETARSIYTPAKGGDDAVQMMKALDQMEAGLQGASDQTVVSQLQDKLAGPVTAAQLSAAAMYDAVCAREAGSTKGSLSARQASERLARMSR